MKKLGFNIIMLGMIASGKDTQANILRKKYALKFVETGVFSRNLLKAKNEDGDLARKTVAKGKPLPTKLLQKFLVQEIKDKPKNKNLLILGGRLKPEAQLIKKIMDINNEKICAFYVTLPDKEVYKRSLGRKESNVKAVFKVLDDKKIIGKRIAWHKDQVGKTVKYYQKLGLMHIINGNQPIPKVTKDILNAIKKHKKHA